MSAAAASTNRSLKSKLLLPLLLIGVALTAVTVWGVYAESQRHLVGRLRLRAELIANLVNYAAENTSHAGELQRIVAAIGAEEDVSFIVVVGGHPARVLASTRNAWLGHALAALPAQEVVEDITNAIQTRQSQTHLDRETDQLAFTTPLLLSQAELADRALSDGAVMVHLDMRATQAAIWQVTREVSLALLVVLAILGALGYRLVQRLVLRPIFRIGTMVAQHRKGADENLVATADRDELGALSHALNDALARNAAVLRELNEQKTVLQEERERLAGIIKGTHAGTWEWNIQTGETIINDRWAEIIGYTLAEISPMSVETCVEYVHPEDLKARDELLEKHFQGALDHYEIELRMQHKDGSWVWVVSRGKVISWSEEGKPLMMRGTLQDITKRKRAAEALRQEQILMLALMDNLPDHIYFKDTASRFLRVNPALATSFGVRDPADVVGKSDADFFSAKHAQEALVDEQTIMRTGQPILHIEEKETWPDGHESLVLSSKLPLRDPAGNIIGTCGISSDISARKQAEKALRASDEKLSLALRAAHMGVWQWDIVADKRSFDDQVCYLLGLNPATFRGTATEFLAVVHPDDREKVAAAFAKIVAQGGAYTPEYRVVWPDGSLHYIGARGRLVRDEAGQPLLLSGIIQDISERKQAEEEKEKLEAQNRQLQKAESLNCMAGAIAHHFNNQLTAVMGNLELAMEDLPQNAEPFTTLDAAMQAGRRAAEVSSLMLTYLGQVNAKREALDLTDACLRSLPLLRAGMPHSVVLETELPAPGPAICANASQIQQVLTNLVTNAWEASGSGDGTVRLTVTTVAAAAIPTVNRFPIGCQPQDCGYACLAVADTGGGIADQDIEKLFDPFFSSKFTGRGLGLAVVLGIVRSHEGIITVESQRGHGSTFRVFLPLSRPQQADTAIPATQGEEGGPAACHATAGAVLLVEDEEAVRKVAASMLARLGFTVLVAQDGSEALTLFQQRHADIQCVLCDLTMPHMDGWATLTAMRKLAPGLPVILASGYDEVQVMAGDHPERPQAFLGKPYQMQSLRAAIEKAIGK